MLMFLIDENVHLIEIDYRMLYLHDRDRFDLMINEMKILWHRFHLSFHCNHLDKYDFHRSFVYFQIRKKTKLTLRIGFQKCLFIHNVYSFEMLFFFILLFHFILLLSVIIDCLLFLFSKDDKQTFCYFMNHFIRICICHRYLQIISFLVSFQYMFILRVITFLFQEHFNKLTLMKQIFFHQNHLLSFIFKEKSA